MESEKNEPQDIIMKASKRTTSVFGGIFNLLNSAVGAGILALPYTFAQVGIFTGIILLLFSSFLTTSTLHYVQRLTFNTDAENFFTIGRMAFGLLGELSILIALIVFLLGALIYYINLSSTAFLNFFRLIFPSLSGAWFNSELVFIIATCLLIFPLACLRDMSSLAKASLVSMACMTCIVLLTVVDYFIDSTAKPSVILAKPLGFASFFNVFSKIMFAFVNHFTMVTTIPQLIQPTIKRRNLVTAGSGLSVVSFYLVGAVFGYLHFGDSVADNILQANVRESMEWIYMFCQFLLAIILVFSYPLLSDPCRSCVEGLCELLTGKRAKNSGTIMIRSVIVTFFIVLFTGIIAFTCHEQALDVLGVFVSFAGPLLIFILPSLLFLRLSNSLHCSYKVHLWERCLAYISIVFGFFFLIFGTYFNTTEFLHAKGII